jgi:muramoyltetrapeptide carboxypeptidase
MKIHIEGGIEMKRKMNQLRGFFLGMALFTGVLFSGVKVTAAGPEGPIKPEALKPGDTISIVAPASELDRERVMLAKKRFEAMGIKVRMSVDLFRKRGYLAGSDERRAEELMEAFQDPEVKAIFPGTGGYGSTRMVDLLDYEIIRQNPKIIEGFSDITALHLAIYKKAGVVTFHGPNIMWGLGSSENLAPFAERYFRRILFAPEYFDQHGNRLPPGLTYQVPGDATPVKMLSPGVARGRLVGGNLSLISPLIGTEFEIDTRGHILFLEDVQEEPYRIDRYLSHLRLAGKIDDAAGVVLGIFRNCEAENPEESLTLEEVFEDYFKDIGKPVIMNFPVGHVRNNAVLPIGTMAELDADRGVLRLLEDPVELGEK